MPVHVRRWLRRMRGGSQPHLVEAGDGHFYVVKPRDNPQHRRILVNEWIAAAFLRFLQIASPEIEALSLGAETIEAFPEFATQRGRERHPVSPGLHFGSRLPGDPTQVALFDTLPNALLSKVANLGDLGGLIAFDRWLANADYRQFVFFRPAAVPGEPRPGFAMWAIDHGFAFQGPQWNLKTASRQGLYHANPFYESIRGSQPLEPWLTRIENFPEAVADRALATLPREWLESDAEQDELERLLEQLFRARARIRHDVEDLLRREAALFPNWPR